MADHNQGTELLLSQIMFTQCSPDAFYNQSQELIIREEKSEGTISLFFAFASGSKNIKTSLCEQGFKKMHIKEGLLIRTTQNKKNI